MCIALIISSVIKGFKAKSLHVSGQQMVSRDDDMESTKNSSMCFGKSHYKTQKCTVFWCPNLITDTSEKLLHEKSNVCWAGMVQVGSKPSE